MAALDLKRLKAKREGLTTYLPAPVVYTVGAIAAFLITMAPVVVWVIIGTVAFLDAWVTSGSVPLAWASFHLVFNDSGYYVMAVWPFIILITAAGVLLAWYRRYRGFYYREVPWHPYQERVRQPVTPHRLFSFIAGPAVLYGMAAYVNRDYYGKILVGNFAFWLASGAFAVVLWELLSDLMLWLGSVIRLWSPPHRRLDLEYELKVFFDSDAQISGVPLREINVDRAGNAVLVGDLTEAQQRRVTELVGMVEDITDVEIKPWSDPKANS